MPLASVARVLRHADTATTYRVYLYFFPDDFAADMDRLDRYFQAENPNVNVSALDEKAENRSDRFSAS